MKATWPASGCALRLSRRSRACLPPLGCPSCREYSSASSEPRFIFTPKPTSTTPGRSSADDLLPFERVARDALTRTAAAKPHRQPPPQVRPGQAPFGSLQLRERSLPFRPPASTGPLRDNFSARPSFDKRIRGHKDTRTGQHINRPRAAPPNAGWGRLNSRISHPTPSPEFVPLFGGPPKPGRRRAEKIIGPPPAALLHPKSPKSLASEPLPAALLQPEPRQSDNRPAIAELPEDDWLPHGRRDRQRTPSKRKPRHHRRESSYDDDEYEAGYDVDREELRRQRKAEKKREQAARAEADADGTGLTPILLPQFISVANFAVAMGLKPAVLLPQLSELGFENITFESIMTGDTAALVAQEYGFEPKVDIGEGVDLQPRPRAEDPSQLPLRPPVVTIMGHVDHGKTTLLDWLRKSSVAAGEHGGITQHIGAFSFLMSSGRQITFLDTPGHAAFLTMRQRGATVTDIVVLVVAADDSVKPQTLEALKHARAAGVPFIVAINKVDKQDVQIEQVKADLARHGVEIEDYGGDVQVVCVSGKTGQGMADLEENIFALADVLDLRAETDGMAEGWVLESSTKPTGRVATVLVKRGTLRKGDCVIAGSSWAKIRVLRNEDGIDVDQAPPGTAVEVLGWKSAPQAGDQVLQAPDEDRAKTAVQYRGSLGERARVVSEMALQEEKRQRASLETPDNSVNRSGDEATNPGDGLDGATEGGGGAILVNLTVKGDVAGSVEAVCATVMELGNNEVRPRILRSAAGQVSEFDVEHAATSGSRIINFNNPIPAHIKAMAEGAGVKILDHSVIYHLADDVRNILSDYLAPEISHKVLGEAEVSQIFPINIRGRVYKNIAGCKIRNGIISRTDQYRLLRKGEKIFEGSLDSLKHGKKDVTEVRKGSECGISFEGWEDFWEGDLIQAYEVVTKKRHL